MNARRPSPSHRSRSLGAALVLLVVANGCDRAPAPMTTLVDSAGVRITMTRASQVAPAQVGEIPMLSLGGPEATGPTQFFRVQNVVFGPERRLWVADGQSSEIRIFNRDGSHHRTVGGRGGGPGEFMRLRLLAPVRSDTVLAWDDSNGRLTVFDDGGDFVRTQALWASEQPVPRAFGVYDDGTLLAQQPRILKGALMEPGRLIRDSTQLVRVDFEGRTRTSEAEASGLSWLWTGRSQVPVPFTSAPAFDVQGRAVHLAQGSAFRIRVFGGGRVLEAYGIERRERPVSRADIDAYRTYVDAFVPESQQDAYIDVLDHSARPTTLPAYARLLLSPEGHTWAQLYTPAPLLTVMIWDVFDETRSWVGQVATPKGFWATGLSEALVAGVWFDADGVEHVRTYPRPRP